MIFSFYRKILSQQLVKSTIISFIAIKKIKKEDCHTDGVGERDIFYLILSK